MTRRGPSFLTLLAAVVTFASARAALAQSFDGAFFGTIGAGLAAHDHGAFSQRLQSYTPSSEGRSLLYQNQEFSGTGTGLHASLGLLFSQRFVVGVAGEQITFPTSESIGPPGSPRDAYDLSGRGAGLDFGYALVNDGGMLIYPFVHGGYYAYSLDYANNQTVPIPFFEGKPVPAGSTVTYTGAAPRWALGVGMTKFIGADGSRSEGGMVLGVRLTWGMMTSRPAWLEPDGSEVANGGLTPGYNGVSLSVSIGGGSAWR